MAEERYLLQFRSEADPREQYMLVTDKKRDQWDTLALAGFQLAAAATIPHISEGSWVDFLEPPEHRYWRKDERQENSAG